MSTVAGVIGAAIDYYLALRLGRPLVLRLLVVFRIREDHLQHAEAWAHSKGAWGILVARFVPGLRSIISLPAGLLKVSPRLFLGTTIFGSFAWSAILIYLGYSTGPLWNSALSSLSADASRAAVAGAVALSSIYLLYYFLTSRSGR